MPELSACIVAKNAERTIRKCLSSLKVCEEIVVIVDTGSEDATEAIAREFTDRVHLRDWPGHIEQKNHAIELASHDWVLCVDADEALSPEMGDAVKAVMAVDEPPVAGYSVNRLNRYLGRWIRHGGWYPDVSLRLFDRRCGRWGGTNPHDHVFLEGPVKRLKVDLLHESYDSLRAHLRTINSYTSILAREKLKKGVRFHRLRMAVVAPAFFVKNYLLKLGFLDGWPGFICCVMGSYYAFSKYAKLWELLHVRDPEVERKQHAYADEKSSSA